MPNNEQKKKSKHWEMVNSEEFRKHHEEHVRKLKTDPEYRKLWEKRMEAAKKFLFDEDWE